MNPLDWLALFNALMDGAERLAPMLAQLRREGKITAAQQAACLARLDALRDETFSGPEWEIVP